MSLKLKRFILPILFPLIFFVGACSVQPEQTGPEHSQLTDLPPVTLTEGQKLNVVATTNIVGDLLGNVGDNMINLTILLPLGADPHSYTPTPQNVTAVANADVIFINGLGLETFLDELIKNAGGDAPIIPLSTNVKLRQFEELVESADHDDDEVHLDAGSDPHIWLSPLNAIIMVENVEQALARLDPANASAYQNNATAYKAELAELDSWVMRQIENIPPEKRMIITDHDAFGYYADRYGLQVLGTVIPGLSANAEASAQDLAQLQQTIAQHKLKAVFVGSTVNPILAERIAEDSGIRLAPLYTASLGQAGSGVESYLDLIRYNTRTIEENLR